MRVTRQTEREKRERERESERESKKQRERDSVRAVDICVCRVWLVSLIFCVLYLFLLCFFFCPESNRTHTTQCLRSCVSVFSLCKQCNSIHSSSLSLLNFISFHFILFSDRSCVCV